MDEKLKPCPFCGSDDVGLCVGFHSDTDAKVICNACSAESSLFGADDRAGKSYEAEAVAAWNRRAAPVVTDEPDNAD